jgi:hypothetical protein
MSSMQEHLLHMKLGEVAAMAAQHPDLAAAAAKLFGGQMSPGIGHNNSEGEINPQGGVTTMHTAEQLKVIKEYNAAAAKVGLPPQYPSTDVAVSPEVVMAQLRELAVEKGMGADFERIVTDNTGAAAVLFGSKTRARMISGNVIEFALKLGLVVLAVGAGLWVVRKIVGGIAMPADVVMP